MRILERGKHQFSQYDYCKDCPSRLLNLCNLLQPVIECVINSQLDYPSKDPREFIKHYDHVVDFQIDNLDYYLD